MARNLITKNYTQRDSKVGIWQSWRPDFGPGPGRRRSSACGNTGAMQPGPKAGMTAQPKPTFESRCVYTGDIIIVSCGAANSAKLLLMSANNKHPKGLANGSDQVGRNYMFHNATAVLAISEDPNLTFFQKTISLNDFYFGMDGFDFPMGNIQMVGKSVGEMYKGEKPLETALAPMFSLDDIAKHAV